MDKTNLSAALVWIVSGAFLVIYSGLGLLGIAVPGVVELVQLMQHAAGWQLYAAAFISILLEGLYIVGNFVPGSTFMIILAILAQAGGPTVFIGTITAIFVGWCMAGAINIYLTAKIITTADAPVYAALAAKDRMLTTWYPAFRANYEVAQVVSGVPPTKVFWSSVRVKIFASIGAALYALAVPYVVDIKTLGNEEGFWTVLAVALLCIGIGIWQLWKK